MAENKIIFMEAAAKKHSDSADNMNNRLRRIRKQLKMTQFDFAYKIGLTGKTLSDIERGKTGLSDRNVKAIASSFSVNPKWLKHGVEPMFEANDVPLESIILNQHISQLELDIIRAYLLLPKHKREKTFKDLATLIMSAQAENTQGKARGKKRESDLFLEILRNPSDYEFFDENGEELKLENKLESEELKAAK